MSEDKRELSDKEIEQINKKAEEMLKEVKTPSKEAITISKSNTDRTVKMIIPLLVLIVLMILLSGRFSNTTNKTESTEESQNTESVENLSYYTDLNFTTNVGNDVVLSFQSLNLAGRQLILEYTIINSSNTDKVVDVANVVTMSKDNISYDSRDFEFINKVQANKSFSGTFIINDCIPEVNTLQFIPVVITGENKEYSKLIVLDDLGYNDIHISVENYNGEIKGVTTDVETKLEGDIVNSDEKMEYNDKVHYNNEGLDTLGNACVGFMTSDIEMYEYNKSDNPFKVQYINSNDGLKITMQAIDNYYTFEDAKKVYGKDVKEIIEYNNVTGGEQIIFLHEYSNSKTALLLVKPDNDDYLYSVMLKCESNNYDLDKLKIIFNKLINTYSKLLIN